MKYREKLDALLAGLVNTFGHDEDAFDMLTTGLVTFGDYVSAVYDMEARLAVGRFRLDGDELTDLMIRLDKSRRTAHDAAIGMATAINRLSDAAGVDHLCPPAGSRREEIGEFCLKIVEEFFHRGQENYQRVTKEEAKKLIESAV